METSIELGNLIAARCIDMVLASFKISRIDSNSPWVVRVDTNHI